jgi:hypothetical protein
MCGCRACTTEWLGGLTVHRVAVVRQATSEHDISGITCCRQAALPIGGLPQRAVPHDTAYRLTRVPLVSALPAATTSASTVPTVSTVADSGWAESGRWYSRIPYDGVTRARCAAFRKCAA